MKAKTLALILFIGLMSITGFGNTTADPAENSTPNLSFEDTSENVVFTAEFVQLSVADATNQFTYLFTETPPTFESEHVVNMKQFNVATLINYEALKPKPFIIEGDVGWPNTAKIIKKSLFPTIYTNSRNPRDGLTS